MGEIPCSAEQDHGRLDRRAVCGRPQDGGMFAVSRNMRRRGSRPMTAQSGSLPEIRLEGESVVFYLDIAAGRGPARLVLRCDSTGNVWSSIAPAAGVDGQAGEEDDEPAA